MKYVHRVEQLYQCSKCRLWYEWLEGGLCYCCHK
jgi:hypothetical protein